MEYQFEKIEETKRKKIINAGIEEFSTQGFERSSLNNILKKSNVSKGFFYHYFKNKVEFYNYIIEFCITVIVDKLNREELLKESDFLLRMQKQSEFKLHVTYEYPKVFDFLSMYYHSVPSEVYLKKVADKTNNFIQRFISENIDYSLFKDEIDKGIAMKISGKYIQQLQREANEIYKMSTFKDANDYFIKELEDFKKVVYKGDKL